MDGSGSIGSIWLPCPTSWLAALPQQLENLSAKSGGAIRLGCIAAAIENGKIALDTEDEVAPPSPPYCVAFAKQRARAEMHAPARAVLWKRLVVTEELLSAPSQPVDGSPIARVTLMLSAASPHSPCGPKEHRFAERRAFFLDTA